MIIYCQCDVVIMFPNIDSSSMESKKQNPSGINLVLEFITLAISIKTEYDSHFF